MGVRNTNCSGCGRPVDGGRCAECKRRDSAEGNRRKNPGKRTDRTQAEIARERETGLRRCTGPCGSWKPFPEFYYSNGKISSRCVVCTREANAERQRQNREKRRAGDPRLVEQKRAQRQRAYEREKELARVGDPATLQKRRQRQRQRYLNQKARKAGTQSQRSFRFDGP